MSTRALLAGLLLASPVFAETPTLPLSPCKLPGLEREAKCGTFEVFEDRARRAGRKIPLRVAVLPANGPERARDAIVPFGGGPGESVVESAAGIAQDFAEILKKRDVLLVDVRGTGSSNGLECPELQGRKGALGALESFFPVPGVKACRETLSHRADTKLYTTNPAMDDVDDVRAALGYEQVDVIGGSYGTRAALVYMRRHGAHVRSAVLEGILPTDARGPLTFAHDAQVALDQVLAACRGDETCRAAFPDPAGDVARVLATLDKAPAKVTTRDAETGAPVTLTLSRAAAAQTLRYMLYQPVTASQVPLHIHLAAAGDYGPLGETAYAFGHLISSAVADGFYLSVTCAEDVPFFDMAEAERAAKGTFLGDFRVRAQKAACAEWPKADVQRAFLEPVRSNVPTLLVSGERDPVTPASAAAHVARTLPRSRSIVVPGGGHGYEGLKGVECLDVVVAAMFEKADAAAIDTSCVAKIEPVPFALKDTRAAEVTLEPAALDRFVGTYASDTGLEVRVKRQGDLLSAEIGDRTAHPLIAIGPSRFKILGAPPGYFASFESKDAAVSTLVLELGPGTTETLRRKPASP